MAKSVSHAQIQHAISANCLDWNDHEEEFYTSRLSNRSSTACELCISGAFEILINIMLRLFFFFLLIVYKSLSRCILKSLKSQVSIRRTAIFSIALPEISKRLGKIAQTSPEFQPSPLKFFGLDSDRNWDSDCYRVWNGDSFHPAAVYMHTMTDASIYLYLYLYLAGWTGCLVGLHFGFAL